MHLRLTLGTLLAVHSIAAAEPTEREPFLWPFASNSIWNTPIGSGAVYTPANINPSDNTWFGGDMETHVIVNAGDPVQEVREPSGNPRWPGGRVLSYMQVPDNLFIGDSSGGYTPNQCTSFLMPDRRTVAQLQPACRITPGAQIVGYRNRDVDIYGSGESGTHWGSGLSTLGGSIRLGELNNHEPFHHALKVNLYAAQYYYYGSDRQGYRWPADRADNYAPGVYGGRDPRLVAGSLLAIPPGVTAASLGLTRPLTLKFFAALQDYGAYVVDDTYWDAICFSYEYGATDEAIAFFGEAPEAKNSSLVAEFKTMFRALHVVDNNSSSNIGGGGTPRRPLAPLLADPAYPVPGSLAASGTVGAVQVTWSDPSNAENTFELQRRAEGGTWSSAFTLPANTTTWTDSAASAGTTWEYRVRVVITPNASAWSATARCLPSGGGGNTPPTVSVPATTTINEDAATGALSVTVGDAETSAGSLTLSASAADTTLLPNSGISLGGSGANRTVTLTPATNRHGSTVVTLTINDGTATSTSSFTLNVQAVNDPPVVTAAPTLGGSPVVGSALTATSGTWNDNADGGTAITYAFAWQRAATDSGSGATTVSSAAGYTPIAGDTGQYLRVTVTATDSGAPGAASVSATSAWILVTTSTPSNTPPTVSVPATTTINEDAATGALSVTVGDAETSAGSLTLSASAADTTLLPNSGISLGGSGANRTVTLTPATNRHGSTVVTLTINDGTETGTSSFTLNVQAVNDPPVVTAAPTLGGSPVVGSALTATSGTWNDNADGGTAITYAFAWQRAATDSGSGATTVSSAAGYTPIAGDTGQYLRVTVTATDSGAPGAASASATSAWILVTITTPITPPPVTPPADAESTLSDDTTSPCGIGSSIALLVFGLLGCLRSTTRRGN